MDLKSEAPDKVFYTVPDAYMRARSQGVTTFEPSTNIYMHEAKAYEINWLVMWALSFVLTNKFRNSQACIDAKNYFNLRDQSGALFRSQTWHDGVKAGMQFVAAHMSFDFSSEDRILFTGTNDAVKKPAKLISVEDLDRVFGAGVSQQVQNVYDDVLKFSDDDGFQSPPTDGEELPPVKPLPPEPEKPAPETPSDPSSPSSWKKPLLWILGILSPFVLWLMGFVIPAPAMKIIDLVIAFLKQIVGMK